MPDTVKKRVVCLDRVFYVGKTTTGFTVVNERVFRTSYGVKLYYNVSRYHSGKGRLPSPLYRAVLEKAGEI